MQEKSFRELQRLLDRAGELLADETSSRWAGWIIYFAEAVESEAGKKGVPRDEIEGIARLLASEFAERAERGYW